MCDPIPSVSSTRDEQKTRDRKIYLSKFSICVQKCISQLEVGREKYPVSDF